MAQKYPLLVTYKVDKLVPRLRFKIRPNHLKMSKSGGPLLGRLKALKSTVTALLRDERIELNYPRGSEARGYAERLIVEAIRNGDCHKPTMELADFWLEDKQVIHKLFKVLVPRFANYEKSFTRLYAAPAIIPDRNLRKCILELQGNHFPPVVPGEVNNYYHLHNILLNEARKEFRDETSSSEVETFSAAKRLTIENDSVDELVENLENVKLDPKTKTDGP